MNKKLIVLAAICAVLLITGLITKHRPQRSIIEQAGLADLFFDDLNADEVQRIEIETVPKKETEESKNEADETVPPSIGPDRDPLMVLEKEDRSWRVASRFGARAKNKAVKDFLKSLAGLKGEFRSDSGDLLADYGLDDSSAMRVRVYTTDREKPADTLLVGKQAGQKTHFVRLAGSNKVYTVDADLRRQVGASSSNLHMAPDYKTVTDLTFLDIKPKDVKHIQLKTPPTEYTLEKQEVSKDDGKESEDRPDDKKNEIWTISTGNLPFELKVDGPKKLLDQASRLNAQEVVGSLEEEKPDKFGLEAPRMEIGFTTSDAATTLLVGSPTGEEQMPGGTYHVNLKGDPLVYSVSRHNIDNLLIRQDQMFDLGLWKLREEDLAEITLNGAITLVRRDNGWTVSDLAQDEKINENRLTSLVKDLLAINAYGPANRLTPDTRGRRIALVENNGNRHELAVGEKDLPGATLPALKIGTAVPVLLEKFKVDRLLPKREELVTKKGTEQENPPPPPPPILNPGGATGN